jgi:hypothetical protein
MSIESQRSISNHLFSGATQRVPIFGRAIVVSVDWQLDMLCRAAEKLDHKQMRRSIDVATPNGVLNLSVLKYNAIDSARRILFDVRVRNELLRNDPNVAIEDRVSVALQLERAAAWIFLLTVPGCRFF